MAIDELGPGSSHGQCDVDRAEACLIALAGLKREARND